MPNALLMLFAIYTILPSMNRYDATILLEESDAYLYVLQSGVQSIPGQIVTSAPIGMFVG